MNCEWANDLVIILVLAGALWRVFVCMGGLLMFIITSSVTIL